MGVPCEGGLRGANGEEEMTPGLANKRVQPRHLEVAEMGSAPESRPIFGVS